VKLNTLNRRAMRLELPASVRDGHQGLANGHGPRVGEVQKKNGRMRPSPSSWVLTVNPGTGRPGAPPPDQGSCPTKLRNRPRAAGRHDHQPSGRRPATRSGFRCPGRRAPREIVPGFQLPGCHRCSSPVAYIERRLMPGGVCSSTKVNGRLGSAHPERRSLVARDGRGATGPRAIRVRDPVPRHRTDLAASVKDVYAALRRRRCTGGSYTKAVLTKACLVQAANEQGDPLPEPQRSQQPGTPGHPRPPGEYSRRGLAGLGNPTDKAFANPADTERRTARARAGHREAWSTTTARRNCKAVLR
jgi:hypothetical protein